MLVFSIAEHQQGVACNGQILQSSNILPKTPTFWLNVRLPLTKAPGRYMSFEAKSIYIHCETFIAVQAPARNRTEISWNFAETQRKEGTRLEVSSFQFISHYSPQIRALILYHRNPTQTLIWHPRVMSQLLSCLHGKHVPRMQAIPGEMSAHSVSWAGSHQPTSTKTGPQKVHCRSWYRSV